MTTKTFSLQEQLPRLPLPTLQSSATKYLNYIKPLLSETEFEKTKLNVMDFIKPGNLGSTLHKRLELVDKESRTSWLDKMWLEKAYMEYREPTLVNVNWFMLWKDHPKQPQVAEPLLQSKFTRFQIHRAARVIRFACEYKQMIENESVQVEFTKNGPICMNQVLNILGVTRIPKPNCDVLNITKLNRLETVVVLLQGQIYSIRVIRNNEIDTVQAIESSLFEVVKSHLTCEKQAEVGILTSENRDVWAKGYDALLGLGNQASFDLINNSLLAISLEDFSSPINQDEKAKIMFCGLEARNRWFDKSLNFVILPDGVGGCNGEHSPCDAVVPSRLVDYIIEKEMVSTDYVDFTSTSSSEKPIHLKWKVNEKIHEMISNAKSNANKLINDTQLAVIHEKNLNSKLFKTTLKTSPDAFVQAALQTTYYKIQGKFAMTYETASTRKFRYGRTETIRPLTSDLMNFVNAFVDSSVANQVKKDKFKKFVDSHLESAKACANGEGFDRHFLGLQVMLKSGESHAIFKDPIFSFIKTFVLSTSNMSPAESYYALGFGPGCFHGYGINYAVSSDMAKLTATAKTSCPETNPFKFRQEFSVVVQQMIDLLSNKSNL